MRVRPLHAVQLTLAPPASKTIAARMRCMITASLRATAIFAFFMPLRLASRTPQAFSADHFSTRVSSVPAACAHRLIATTDSD